MNTLTKQHHLLQQKRADLIAEAKRIFAAVDAEGRDLTAAEKDRDDAITHELDLVAADLNRYERQQARVLAEPPRAPAHLKLPRGDSWAQGFSHWVRTGDKAALDAQGFEPVDGAGMEGYTIQAASNPTDMNIGTAADGGDTVPTGFYGQIIARRDEMRLSAKLPLLKVPGQGTTVDVPVDNEADGEFVSTTEAADFDLDAPALAKKSMTLVLYSKYTDVSYQLLNDTPTNLLEFLGDFVGRGMAKKHNDLLLTEVASGGTSFKTFASITAIAAGDPEAVVGNNDLGAYLDDESAIAWVTRSATHWGIKALTGSAKQYAPQPYAVVASAAQHQELLGYPVLYSQKAAAIAASAKSIYFGNWRYVGYRESPELTFIRDPYTVAIKGQVRLLWHFRTVYKVLQAEAIGYGVHASA